MCANESRDPVWPHFQCTRSPMNRPLRLLQPETDLGQQPRTRAALRKTLKEVFHELSDFLGMKSGKCQLGHLFEDGLVVRVKPGSFLEELETRLLFTQLQIDPSEIVGGKHMLGVL